MTCFLQTTSTVAPLVKSESDAIAIHNFFNKICVFIVTYDFGIFLASLFFLGGSVWVLECLEGNLF